jgi:hypothetical protein
VFQREIARLRRQFPPEIAIKGYEVYAAGSFYVRQVAAVIILTDFQFFFSNPHSRGRLCHKILADAQSIIPLHHLLSSITSSHSGQINDSPASDVIAATSPSSEDLSLLRDPEIGWKL